MRTTIRLDDSLLRELTEAARREKTSVNGLMGRLLLHGLHGDAAQGRQKRRFREHPSRLGLPKVDLTKALALAAALEDTEVTGELAARR